jgi:hypothetical protein
MQIKRNWKARFLLWLVGAVKVTRLQSSVANLSNPLICGRYSELSTSAMIVQFPEAKKLMTSKRNLE